MLNSLSCEGCLLPKDIAVKSLDSLSLSLSLSNAYTEVLQHQNVSTAMKGIHVARSCTYSFPFLFGFFFLQITTGMHVLVNIGHDIYTANVDMYSTL